MPPARLRTPSFLLGFALGGFFDGILLHQILQWHHLLSLWTRPDDFAFQSTWDGLFHAAHYAIAAGALYVLWRRRGAAAEAGAGRLIAGWAFLGFGAWHILDVVAFHWILVMHRIRIGVENPLAYDLAFVALGLVSLLIGLAFLRRPGGSSGRAVAAGVAALALVSGPVAALPPRDPDPAVAALLEGRSLPAFCGAWTQLAAQPER
jgi:uncharacterized membrane protein